MRLCLGCLVMVGCEWLDEADRLDLDGDGFPGASDCNDVDEQVSQLVADSGSVTCGDVVTGDMMGASAPLGVVNCLQPFDEGRLVQLAGRQRIFRFMSPEAAAVSVVMDGSEFWLSTNPFPEGSGIGLFVNRGSTCRVDTCQVGLPATGERDPAERGPWSPSVQFTAGADEVWYIVIAGGNAELSGSPFTLDISCE